MSFKKGLTLIEILLVIVILSILAALIIVALNPAQNVSDANDQVTQHELNQIGRAIQQWSIATVAATGAAPAEITGLTAVTALSDSGLDLCPLVPTYIAEIPAAPGGTAATGTLCSAATAYDTGYTINYDPTTSSFVLGNSAGTVTTSPVKL